ncbi:MAG TPA: cyclic nucleotide-binding domain-containing protein [Vicinamibacterales bacterium]|nr:cyclic nucleotide-binding domain-containing protein [Vicinamibacterales bacterium]
MSHAASLTPLTSAQLRELPMLRDVPAEAAELLRPLMFSCVFTAGDRILKAGDFFDGCYYIVEGQVDVRVPPVVGLGAADAAAPIVVEGVAGTTRPGARLTIDAGDIFAEGSALTRMPLAVDYYAATAVSCVLIRTAALRAMFDLPELAAFKATFDRKYKERTLRAHLQRTDLFKNVDRAIIETVISRAELVTFKPGKTIAVEGTPCDAYYLVRGGYIKVSARLDDSDVTLTYLRIGDSIGEATLVLNEPWPFSLTAIEHVELVKISQDDLRRLLPDAPRDRRLWDRLVGRLQHRGRVLSDPASTEPLAHAVATGLIRGESVLLIDLDTCVRCDECVRGCADAHDGVPRFVREGAKFRNYTVPTACYHCTDPVCMIGCPTGAISRPLGTREVAVNAATCIGCGNCVRRCPWGNILTTPFDSPRVGESIDLATKCDLCIDRPEGPACVQMCPHGSARRINFKDEAEVEALFNR